MTTVDSYSVSDLTREVRSGRRSIPDARLRLGLPPEPDVRVDLLTRLAWAIVWRAGALGAVGLALAGATPVDRRRALLGAVAFLAAGFLLRVWRRRRPLGSVWRLTLAGALAAFGPSVVVAGAMGFAVVDAVAFRRPVRHA